MGRIFLSAAHGGLENGIKDPGTIAGGTTEAKEMILVRDLIVAELRSRKLEVLAVPDELSQEQTIDWINYRAREDDLALEIQANGASNPSIRGTTIFYITANDERKADAEKLIIALLRRVPQLPNRGAKPDSATGLGMLVFCRWILIPSLLLEIGYLTNPEDRTLIQTRRREIAQGIADGLVLWNRGGSNPTPPPNTYFPINININGQNYGEKGVLINGNSYIPIDLVDRLKIDLSKISRVRRVSYKNIVYIKAIELRSFNISVTWDNPNRAVVLRSSFKIFPGNIDKIMTPGSATEVQLMMFLKANNEKVLNSFPDIAKLYREEGTIEGVNYDLAFSQMCLETNFLRFGGDIRATQNNFAALGSVGGSAESAAFPSARIGVRAHIQHLKAYATTEPLVQDVVDPRFRFVTRGIAPLVDQLSGRWAADLQYGSKILTLVKRLYEIAGLM
ncbi:cell wall hydrolase [Oscillatoriales cyanobacterium USR001]|nr:cell wall hydrolase [Oscillatoriales cyanobacterium USR001]